MNHSFIASWTTWSTFRLMLKKLLYNRASVDGHIGTIQNRFLKLDTFFICLLYGILDVGIGGGVMQKAVPHNKCQINNTEYYQKIPFY